MKKVSLLIFLLVIVSVMVSGCGGNNSVSESVPAPEKLSASKATTTPYVSPVSVDSRWVDETSEIHLSMNIRGYNVTRVVVRVTFEDEMGRVIETSPYDVRWTVNNFSGLPYQNASVKIPVKLQRPAYSHSLHIEVTEQQ